MAQDDVLRFPGVAADLREQQVNAEGGVFIM